jgi:hypothetical protein
LGAKGKLLDPAIDRPLPRDPPACQVFNQIGANLARASELRYGVCIGPNLEKTMPTWMTAKQISARFTVGEERLLEYGKRGNLAMYRMDDGSVLFDSDGAARYFRPRNAVATGNPQAQNMGVLGTSRLGEAYVNAPAPSHRTSLGARESPRPAICFDKRASAAAPTQNGLNHCEDRVGFGATAELGAEFFSWYRW